MNPREAGHHDLRVDIAPSVRSAIVITTPYTPSGAAPATEAVKAGTILLRPPQEKVLESPQYSSNVCAVKQPKQYASQLSRVATGSAQVGGHSKPLDARLHVGKAKEKGKFEQVHQSTTSSPLQVSIAGIDQGSPSGKPQVNQVSTFCLQVPNSREKLSPSLQGAQVKEGCAMVATSPLQKQQVHQSITTKPTATSTRVQSSANSTNVLNITLQGRQVSQKTFHIPAPVLDTQTVTMPSQTQRINEEGPRVQFPHTLPSVQLKQGSVQVPQPTRVSSPSPKVRKYSDPLPRRVDTPSYYVQSNDLSDSSHRGAGSINNAVYSAEVSILQSSSLAPPLPLTPPPAYHPPPPPSSSPPPSPTPWNRGPLRHMESWEPAGTQRSVDCPGVEHATNQQTRSLDLAHDMLGGRQSPPSSSSSSALAHHSPPTARRAQWLQHGGATTGAGGADRTAGRRRVCSVEFVTGDGISTGLTNGKICEEEVFSDGLTKPALVKTNTINQTAGSKPAFLQGDAEGSLSCSFGSAGRLLETHGPSIGNVALQKRNFSSGSINASASDGNNDGILPQGQQKAKTRTSETEHSKQEHSELFLSTVYKPKFSTINIVSPTRQGPALSELDRKSSAASSSSRSSGVSEEYPSMAVGLSGRQDPLMKRSKLTQDCTAFARGGGGGDDDSDQEQEQEVSSVDFLLGPRGSNIVDIKYGSKEDDPSVPSRMGPKERQDESSSIASASPPSGLLSSKVSGASPPNQSSTWRMRGLGGAQLWPPLSSDAAHPSSVASTSGTAPVSFRGGEVRGHLVLRPFSSHETFSSSSPLTLSPTSSASLRAIQTGSGTQHHHFRFSPSLVRRPIRLQTVHEAPSGHSDDDHADDEGAGEEEWTEEREGEPGAGRKPSHNQDGSKLFTSTVNLHLDKETDGPTAADFLTAEAPGDAVRVEKPRESGAPAAPVDSVGDASNCSVDQRDATPTLVITPANGDASPTEEEEDEEAEQPHLAEGSGADISAEIDESGYDPRRRASYRISTISEDGLRTWTENARRRKGDSGSGAVTDFRSVIIGSLTDDEDTDEEVVPYMEKLKNVAARLKLATRRASTQAWRERVVGRSPSDWRDVETGSGSNHKKSTLQDFGDVVDESESSQWAEDRQERINEALSWVRRELLYMRQQDQTLARYLITLRHDIQQLKLARSYAEHQETIDDAADELEEARHLAGLTDTPREHFSTPLKQFGVTRMNINSRRFSVF